MSNVPFYTPPPQGLVEPGVEGSSEGVGGARPAPAPAPAPPAPAPQPQAAPGLREVTVEGPREGVEGTPRPPAQPAPAPAPAATTPATTPATPNYHPSTIPNTPMATGPAAVPAGRQDAWAFIQTELDQWGLGGLADTARNLIVGGAGDEETMRVIRSSDTYKQRFAGMEARRKAGFNPITEGQYMQLEDSYKGIFRAYGLPANLYDDPSDFAKYIGDDISPDEMNTRVVEHAVWWQDADPDYKAQAKALYGLSDGDLIAMSLDPDKAIPFLEQRKTATEIATQAARSGWGQLTTSEAEQLQGMGINESQATSGFAQLATVKPLFQEAIGEAGGDFTNQQQLDIAFGNDVAGQRRLSRRQRARQNSTQAGGGAVTSSQGTALGSVT